MHRRLRRTLILAICLGLPARAVAETYPIRFRAVPNPEAGLAPLEMGEPSTLPSGWKFWPTTPSGTSMFGPLPPDVTLDPSNGEVIETYRVDDVGVGAPLAATTTEYASIMSDRTMHRLWSTATQTTRSVPRGTARTGSVFRVELPVQFPKAVRSIVGDGAPNLQVQGSETISLGGTSSWTSTPQVSTEYAKQSVFPSLEMKQELNVNLTGSIGDKIKVDVDQSSNVVTSLDNQVKLRYEGDENDMIKSVELGNTNLSVEGASFRQEGLFGVKTVAKLGTVDVVAIASRQQGKTESATFTPSGEKTHVQIFDLSYIHRQYFLLADHITNITTATLTVWKDDHSPLVTTDPSNTSAPALARLDPTAPPDSTTNPQYDGNFKQLKVGDDYTIITPWLSNDPQGRGYPVLRLTTPLADTDVLAVTYYDATDQVQVGDTSPKAPDKKLLKVLRVSPSQFNQTDTNGFYSPADPWYPTLIYELRNFYDLGGRDIALETLDLSVRQVDTGQAVNPDNVNGTPLIEMLGLDQQGVLGSAAEDKPDGKVDSQFLERTTGILFFPDIHPFDPDTTQSPNCVPGYGTTLCLDNYDRNRLRDCGTCPNRANPFVYYYPKPDPGTQIKYYIDAYYRSAQQGFSLGRFDILENSETVKIDGIPARKGIDYNIDYTTGQITFITAPGPDQTITVDYSFAPGAGGQNLTLTGASASYVPSPNFSMTSSVIYNTKAALEANPKLGEEPANSLVTNLASVMQFKPVWMTQLANVVPGVHTNVPSTLNIQGNTSISMPNPNTAGEAYLDDMEGDKQIFTVPLSRPQWFWSGYPIGADGQPSVPLVVSKHARLQWFNPTGDYSVHEGDLKPYLSDTEGKVARPVLGLNVIAPTGGTLTPDAWTGLTVPLSSSGLDLGQYRYVEIWVNDFRMTGHSGTQGVLHLDFGHATEDAFWDPNNPPNNKLDTEDKNFNNTLDAGSLETGEDTGLDGLFDQQEPGYDPVTNPDPNHDDYYYDSSKPTDYSGINNCERNATGLPNARPDTEDLNRDGVADFYNIYYEATVDLSKSKAEINADTEATGIEMVTDVPADYPGANLRAGNGWRLYRIPISAEAFTQYGTGASWRNVQNARIWLDGMADSLRLQIGGIEVTGNRWTAEPLGPSEVAHGVQFNVNSLNNKDNLGGYVPPPITIGNTAGTTTEKREQSLALTYSGLQYGDSVLAFKTLFDPNNGLGWTQYGVIQFWAHGSASVAAAPMRVFARFGADTVNYYEYSAPLRVGWQNLSVPMTILSQLKELRPGSVRIAVDSTSRAATGEVFTVVGNPSFTRILRNSFGVTLYPVGGSAPNDTSSGQVWIDELRLSDVEKNVGGRGDMIVQANFADVLAMNVNYSKQGENFVRVGSATAAQGSGVNSTDLGFSSTFNLDRMMPTSGVQLPIRFSVQHSTDVPKFQPGSDVVLTSAMSSQATTKSNRQSLDLTYRRAGTNKGLAKYTIDALNLGMTITSSNGINTSSIDSTRTFLASGAYEVPLGGLGVRLWRGQKINLLPDRFQVTSAWNSSWAVSYARTLSDTSSVDSSILRSSVVARDLTLGANATWTPLTSVTVRLQGASRRNMLLHQPGPFGFNKGTEVDQTRSLGINYIPHWLPFFAPTLAMTGGYHATSGPAVRVNAADALGLSNIDNRGTVRLTATVPLGKLAQMANPRKHPTKASAAETGASTILTPIRLVVSRLQDIQGTFTIDRGSVMTRVLGDPSFIFGTGFTSNPGTGVTTTASSNTSSTRSYTSGANTTFRPAQTLTLDLRADRALTYTASNLNGAYRTNRVTLPDIKARWVSLERVLGMQKTFSSIQLNSGLNFRKDEQGPEGGPVWLTNTATTWGPILGWDLVWKNGLHATVNSTYSTASSLDSRVSNVTSTRDATSTDIRLTKTYSPSKGFRFPWSKHPIKLKNDLNLNLTISTQSTSQTVLRPGYPPSIQVHNQLLNVTSSTSYNFTQSISGGFNLGFRQNKDLKQEITTRGITLGLNGQFRF
jgi:hypothetical protein